MDEILKIKLRDVDYPILLTLSLVVIAVIVISIGVFNSVKKIKPNQAPKGLALVAEQYFVAIDKNYDDISESRLPIFAPYIFSIVTFLLLGNLVGLVGLEALATSYTIPLFLAFISWFGIYAIGIFFQKWHFFKRYINPIEIVGSFSPLISLSFRMFGNIIGGATVLLLFYTFMGWIGSLIPKWNSTPYIHYLLAPIFTPILHMYFDLFGAVIQTYVFAMITTLYWTLEAETVTKKTKNKKSAVIKNKQTAAIY